MIFRKTKEEIQQGMDLVKVTLVVAVTALIASMIGIALALFGGNE